MASAEEIREQTARELHRRTRLAVPAFAGGFLYLLSAVVISSTLNGLPKVGPLQGLEPTLQGISEPSVSPRAAEVKFISRHTFPLLSGSVLAAAAIAALTLVLLLLFDAASFRRPSTWPQARFLVIVGGAGFALAGIVSQIVHAVETHNFANGSDFSRHAVEQALTKSTANEVIAYVSLLAGLALFVGMVIVLLNSLRTGLLPRWMAFLGMFSALLILLPFGATLQLVPAFWLVMMGMLLSGRWPGGDPPAWEAGEARPWPSRAQMQAERGAGRAGAPAPAGASAGDVAPAPTQPSPSASARKRRRKRGGRG